MNYFKYLFALVLSVGIVSSAFAQPSYNPEQIKRCLSGLYAGDTRITSYWFSADPIYNYEMEVGYKPSSGGYAAGLIFLFHVGGEGQFCTSYTSPNIELILEGSDYAYVVSPKPRGKSNSGYDHSYDQYFGTVGQISKVLGGAVFPYTSCNRVEFETDLGDSVFGYKTSRPPRSYDELSRICGLMNATMKMKEKQ